jgi:hypothetical protein
MVSAPAAAKFEMIAAMKVRPSGKVRSGFDAPMRRPMPAAVITAEKVMFDSIPQRAQKVNYIC